MRRDAAATARRPPPGLRPPLAHAAHLGARHLTEERTMTIKIVAAHEQASPAGKLAEAEVHFPEGTLAGLKLIGFANQDQV